MNGTGRSARPYTCDGQECPSRWLGFNSHITDAADNVIAGFLAVLQGQNLDGVGLVMWTQDQVIAGCLDILDLTGNPGRLGALSPVEQRNARAISRRIPDGGDLRQVTVRDQSQDHGITRIDIAAERPRQQDTLHRLAAVVLDQQLGARVERRLRQCYLGLEDLISCPPRQRTLRRSRLHLSSPVCLRHRAESLPAGPRHLPARKVADADGADLPGLDEPGDGLHLRGDR